MVVAHLFFIFMLTACAQSKVMIHDLKSKQIITQKELLSTLPTTGTIVLSEHHYSPPIQSAQASLIQSIVTHHKAEANFSVAWEFLDFPRQKEVSASMHDWQQGLLTNNEFLTSLFSSEQSARRHQVYLPILKNVRDLDGQLVATNAPREWKRIITSKGLSALDAKLIPKHCLKGSDQYFARFEEVMKDHVQTEELERYFEAQYYTDCVVANSVEELAKFNLKFLVVGSFHSDYNDGVIRNLQHISADETYNIKLIDARKLSQAEVDALIVPHEKYGRIADYLYIIK